MAVDLYLVTKGNASDKWAFLNEADILPSLELTYSETDHVVDKVSRELYVVRITREDVINQDVFTVQRVAALEKVTHL